jgi:hypothetical protein
MNRIAMCEIRSREKMVKKINKSTSKYSDQQQKEMDCDEPHLETNEKNAPNQ